MAPAGPRADRSALTTARQRLVPGEPGDGGYRALVPADGEPHLVQDLLGSFRLRPGWPKAATPLLVIAQLSDTHIMDHQSPGRVELLDRFADLDSPLRDEVGIIGMLPGPGAVHVPGGRRR